MTEPLTIERLTRDRFAPFGEIIEIDENTRRSINGGTTERYHALATAEATGDNARIVINLFCGQPRSFPYLVQMMERHPLGSQSFSPLSGRPYLVIVAEDDNGRPGRPHVFLAKSSQGVNYRRNVWHHPLMALDAASMFLVVDRDGSGCNLEEHVYDVPFIIGEPYL